MVFVGTPRGLESRLVPRAGYQLELLPILPLNGVGPARAEGAARPAWAMLAVRLVRRAAARARCSASAATPAARSSLPPPLLGVRTVILEPNAKPGFTNRVLRPFVRHAACAYEEARRAFGARGVLTGNPVRGEFARLPRKAHSAAATPCSSSAAARARGCSTTRWWRRSRQLPGAERLRIVHQTGDAMRDAVTRPRTRRRGGRRRCWPSSTTWSGASPRPTSWSPAAGATTCAELTAAGKASVLIPFARPPTITSGSNAAALAAAGAALMVEETRALRARASRRPSRAILGGSPAPPGDGQTRARRWPSDAAARVADLLLGAACLSIQQVHFVGIGGSGMSGIAEVLLNLGYPVSGSDLTRAAVTERLPRLGARVFEGHAAGNVRDAAGRGHLHRRARRQPRGAWRPAACGSRSSRGRRCWPS